MSRPLRIEYPGAWYHVMNRGAAKQLIFHNNNHYEIFLKLLTEIHCRFQVRIHAYCLMPNHYHILLQTPLPNLSCVMRHLDSLYTRRFNLSQKRDGPLLRGRFKSIIIDNENYLLRLSRYIHLNPVRANLVTHANDYIWSSYRAYLSTKNKPFWLSTDEILNRFGPNKQAYKYRIFIAEGIDDEINSFYKKLKLLPILGCEAFTKSISENYLKERQLSPEISQQKYLKIMFSSKQVMQAVAQYYGVDELNLKTVKYKTSNRPRQIAIYLAVKFSGEKYKIIADEFARITIAGISKVYQRISKEIAINKALNDEINLLEKYLLSFVQT